ncbi:RNA-directed DNA polymerase, eukaryota, reverse transcriptase zinc-binding domain protein [Tanacetum coccineum]
MKTLSIGGRVIKAIHGKDAKLGNSPKSGYSSISIDIVRDISLLYNKGIDLLGLIKKNVGNEENTMFWEETWKREVPLKSFISSPRGGVEQNQMADLSSHVEGSIFPNILDRWTWTLSGSGEFSVALVRNLKDDQILEEIASKNRWIKAILKKVKIHVWRVKLENLPTRLNLSRRSMDLDSIFCPTCNLAVESTSHDINKKIANRWDINILVTSNYEEWWAWFMNLRLPAKLKMILEGVFYITWWSV